MWTLFYRDLWGPVWPNLAASIVTLPVAFVWHHRRVKAHIDRAIAEATQPQPLIDFSALEERIKQWKEGL